MKIILNGQDFEIEDNSTVQNLLDKIGNKSKMLVVEQNLNIVLRENFEKTILNDGDAIEVVAFAGGG